MGRHLGAGQHPSKGGFYFVQQRMAFAHRPFARHQHRELHEGRHAGPPGAQITVAHAAGTEGIEHGFGAGQRIGFEAAPGGGSVFWFQIPLAPAQGPSGPQLTLAYLRRLLETESLMARTLWGQCRPVLLPLLGQDAGSMEQALEQAELSRALELLGRPMGGGNE